MSLFPAIVTFSIGAPFCTSWVPWFGDKGQEEKKDDEEELGKQEEQVVQETMVEVEEPRQGPYITKFE